MDASGAWVHVGAGRGGWCLAAFLAAILAGGCGDVQRILGVDGSADGAVSDAAAEGVAGGREVIEVEVDPFALGSGGRDGTRLVVEALEEGWPLPGEVYAGDGVAGEDRLVAMGGLPGDVVAEGPGREGVSAVAEGAWTKDGAAVSAADVVSEADVLAIAEDDPAEAAYAAPEVAESGLEESPAEDVVDAAVEDVVDAAVEDVEGDGGVVVPEEEPAVPECGGISGAGGLYEGDADAAVAGELEGVWRMQAGRTVAEVIRGWTGPLGWRVADSASVEWRIGHSAACRGSLLGAVSYLVDALSGVVPAPVVTLYGGNRVLVLEDDGSVLSPF